MPPAYRMVSAVVWLALYTARALEYNMNIFVIGDSISIHYGPALEAALKGLGIGYDRKTGMDAAQQDMNVGRGANGGDSAMVLAYLRQCASQGPAIAADTLLVNCGLHDIKTDPATGRRQVPIEAYRGNLEAIVMLATGALARRMVWIRTTPCDERVHNARCSEFHRFAADCDAYNRAADAVMAARPIAGGRGAT